MGLPVPEGLQKLLGLVNDIGKFITDLKEMTAPLRELLVKNGS